MNFKTTYILFGLLAVLLAVLGFILYRGGADKSETGFIFPTMHAKDAPLPSDEIDKIVIEQIEPAGKDIVLERGKDKNWTITSPRKLAADSSLVDRMIDALHGARIEPEVKPPTPEKAGLTKPSRKITLSGKGKTFTLTVGAVSPGKEEGTAYVFSTDVPKKVLAVKKSSLEAGLEGLRYFRTKDLLGGTYDDIRSVSVSQGKKTVELKKDGETWVLAKPDEGPADIGTLLQDLTALKVDKDDDFVADNISDPKKVKGLAEALKDTVTIKVTRAEGKKTTTSTLVVGLGAKEKDQYLGYLGSSRDMDVVRFPAAKLTPLLNVLKDEGSLRNRNLVNLGEFKQPDAIDVTNSYKDDFGVLEFRKPEGNNSWELFGKSQSTVADAKAMRELIDALNLKNQARFADSGDRKKLELEKPDYVVKIYAGALKKPDPKKKGKPEFKKGAEPVAELRFGKVEKESVAVERIWGKHKAIVWVPARLRDIVRRGPLAYFDKTLPSFNSGSADDNVTRVEISRPKGSYEIVREGTGPWKFAPKTKLAGKDANAGVIQTVLNELNHLTAIEIETEKASVKQLSDFGLARPRYRVEVTITKDKKATKHEFLFGKDKGKDGVYMKLSGKDAIYVVEQRLLAPLDREVRDTTVFNFDTDKVTRLAVTGGGWKGIKSVVLEKSKDGKRSVDGKWTVTAPKDFEFKESAINRLLGTLARLQAATFVDGSGKNMAVKQGGMVIQIELEGEKGKKLTLTLGAEIGNAYYATSSDLKGETFTVEKKLFEPLRKSFLYFSDDK